MKKFDPFSANDKYSGVMATLCLLHMAYVDTFHLHLKITRLEFVS